ncbi:MAG TPA: tetratricopeptide repeat protein [Pyrinomonadaceae bacterium]|jgi:tetratricopeptide (TPR) repeat protein|nr:tetratricopeptide repeat protein [Pyrinomonadaceae bacterium]
MNLTSELAMLRRQSTGLSRNEQAKLSGDLAKNLQKIGEYEAAAEALQDFWPDRNEQPQVDDLDPAMKATILLRIGGVLSAIGSAGQTAGSQERAKNLLTQALETFSSLGDEAKVAEAQGDLALCYWREGALDEARIALSDALARLGDVDPDLKAVLLIRAGIIEVNTARLQNALKYYNEAQPLVDKSNDHALKGAFHFEYGLVFRRLATPENREDYLDRALIEYAAASFHYEQAGNERYQAGVENNLGYLYFTIGRYKEAHKHLDRARTLYTNIKDVLAVAHVDDTRARVLLAENRLVDAERVIRQAIRTLERGEQQSDLAEALTTYGVVLGRLGRHARSRELLERAIEVSEIAGNLEGAARARLSIIEELKNQTPPSELAKEYEAAVSTLTGSQDPATAKRLVNAAVQIIDSLAVTERPDPNVEIASWEGFSFKREVLKVEKSFIERALRDAGGSVTRASRLLGFRHHQSLIALINSRHRDLLGTRSAVRKRRHHLFSKPRKTRKTSAPATNAASYAAQSEATDAISDSGPVGESN